MARTAGVRRISVFGGLCSRFAQCAAELDRSGSIDDPFFRFWFQVVAPHRAVLATAGRDVRTGLWKRFERALLAEAWEALCRDAIPGLAGRIEQAGNAGIWLPAKRWWHGGATEWDAVSSTVDGTAFLAGEVKWTDRPVGRVEIERLAGAILRRPLPPGLPPNTHRALFVTKRDRRLRVAGKGVHVFDADDVMKVLV